MKKILGVCFLISAAISSAYAASPEIPTYKSFNGFNLGFAGGYYITDFQVSINSVDGFQANDDLQANAAYFHSQVGYGHAFNQFYLGFNIFADLGQANDTNKISAKVDNQNVSKEINSSLNNVYGLVLTPGVVAAPNVLIYGLGGLVVGGQNLSVEDETVISNGHKPGWIVGTGAEYLFCKNLSINAEWSYLHLSRASEFSLFGVPYDTQKVSANRFLLGIKYYI